MSIAAASIANPVAGRAGPRWGDGRGANGPLTLLQHAHGRRILAVGPRVVGVSELRRRRPILSIQVERGAHPLFVTQHGRVSAVLHLPKRYDDWCPDGGRRH